ncbi:hypothetical protein N7461_003936 [Penicillium sp. DV-2018c]|nr:hypothetical protein N7461_003936 [Penicillium sp. DV-2018c]
MANAPLPSTIPPLIWERFKDQLSDDLPRFMHFQTPSLNPPHDGSHEDLALYYIEQHLAYHEKTMADYGLQRPIRDWNMLIGYQFQELRDELSYDRNESQAEFEQLHALMNHGQASIFNEVIAQIENNPSNARYFLHGPGGTGFPLHISYNAFRVH